jgi:hypothetical protein
MHLSLSPPSKQEGEQMVDTGKRKIDDLFPEYDIKTRNWLLGKLKEDLTRSGVPKNNLYHYLMSPSKESEDDPLLKDKYLTESISNIRRFLQALWPKKKRRGRMIETDMDWTPTD